MNRADRASPSWYAKTEELAPGPTWCVDIDGVLADARHRQYLIEGQYQDWDQFFQAAGGDGLLEPQKILLDSVSSDTFIALVTARSDWIASLTVNWLIEHEVRWDLLVMRSTYDWRPSAVMKTEAVAQLRSRGFEPTLAIDDDRRNVAAYERLEIPCLYIHSGYHD